MTVVLLYIFVIAILSLYYLFRRNYDYWEKKGVPYDKPYLIFGSIYEVFVRKQDIFTKIRSIYDQFKSPYVGIYIFNQPNLLVRSPEIIKKILVKDFDKFVNRPLASDEKIDPLAFHTLFSAKDATWKSLRTKLSPVFTSGKMKLMFPLKKECAENLHENLSNLCGTVVEFRRLIKKYSVDVISSCAFGINANCLKKEESDIYKMSVQILDPKSIIRAFSLFCFFFVPKLMQILRLTFSDKAASKSLLDIFKATLKERENRKIERNDLIDVLNNLKKSETVIDQYKFDDVKMGSQAIMFFSAGNDTTALTTLYCFYELALKKSLQDRLRKEIRESFEKNSGFTYDGILSMKYLNMVLNETLRKYPLTTFLQRCCTATYTIEETGLQVDKNTAIIIPVAGLHYDPEYYPDPETFDPERFSDENKANITPYTFLPFGEGPRNCIGRRFGEIAVKVALCHILKDFEVSPVDTTPVPIKFYPASMFLQNKDGIPLKVNKLEDF